MNDEIADIKRRAGIIDEGHATNPEHVNLSHAGRKAKLILNQMSDLMVDLEDELYDIKRANPEFGEELLKYHRVADYRSLYNAIFRKF